MPPGTIASDSKVAKFPAKPAVASRKRFDSSRFARWERRVIWVLVAYLALVCALLLLSDEMRAGLARAPLWIWPLALAITSGALLLRALRWIALSRAARVSISAGALVGVYLSGFPLTLTPARAGELWRAWLMKRRYHVPARTVLPLIAADRLLDLNVLAIFAALFFAPSAIAYVLCIALLVLPATSLSHGGRIALAVVKGAWRVAGKRAPRRAAFFSATARGLTAVLSWKRYVPLLALSLAAWGLEVAAMVVVLNALNGTITFAGAASALGIANIAGVLTFIPGGIGGQEATLGALFVAAGNSAAVAVLAVAVMRICTLWYSIALGTPILLTLSARNTTEDASIRTTRLPRHQ